MTMTSIPAATPQSGAAAPAASGVQKCVVCGAASHRTDWINKGNGYVACDNHTPAQITTATQAKAAPTPAIASGGKMTSVAPAKAPTPTTASASLKR